MKAYRLVIFDLDGVLYRGAEAIPGAAETVARLKEHDVVVRYMTNNSTKTRDEFARKLQSFEINASASEVFTSAACAGLYLGETAAFVVGEPGLRAELSAAGVNVVDSGPAEWVVVGACWHLTYEMIDEAQWRIRNGAKFLATNPDPTFPIEGGRLRPGAGTIVAAVQTAAGRTADVMIGKPEPTLIEMILSETGISREEALVVGDQPATDIECAIRAGVDSALVLTGVASSPSKDGPTYVFPDVTGVLGFLR